MRVLSRAALFAVALGIGAVAGLSAYAADEDNDNVLPAVTSWIGNTFGYGHGMWTQIDITSIAVSPDGKVYTNSPWDESGAEASVYQNGKQLEFAGGTHGCKSHGGRLVGERAVRESDAPTAAPRSADVRQGGQPLPAYGVQPPREGPRLRPQVLVPPREEPLQ